MFSKVTLGSAACLALALLATGCLAGEEQLSQRRGAIINGSPEAAYPGVGALLIHPVGGTNSLCTASIIGEEWVLTAASCVADFNNFELSFATGSDVSNPPAVYPVRSIHPHPAYLPASSSSPAESDLALVNVFGLSGANKVELNTTSISGYDGTPIKWVGYGVDQADPSSGEGIKRSAAGTIDYVTLKNVHYLGGGALPCHGDTGGPTFLTHFGREQLVGVISSADARCETAGVDTRVDTHAFWVPSTMDDGPTPDCDLLGGDCLAGACWPADASTTFCAATAGVGLGESCDASDEGWPRGVDCADGATCWTGANGDEPGVCSALCTTFDDCADGELCNKPAFDGFDQIGVCLSSGIHHDQGVTPADAGLPAMDGAAPSSDAATVVPDAGDVTPQPPKNSSGCSVGDQSTPAWGLTSLLLLLALCWRRRR